MTTTTDRIDRRAMRRLLDQADGATAARQAAALALAEAPDALAASALYDSLRLAMATEAECEGVIPTHQMHQWTARVAMAKASVTVQEAEPSGENGVGPLVEAEPPRWECVRDGYWECWALHRAEVALFEQYHATLRHGDPKHVGVYETLEEAQTACLAESLRQDAETARRATASAAFVSEILTPEPEPPPEKADPKGVGPLVEAEPSGENGVGPELIILRKLLHDEAVRMAYPRTATALSPLLSLPGDLRSIAQTLDAVDLVAIQSNEYDETGACVYSQVRPLLIRWMRAAYLDSQSILDCIVQGVAMERARMAEEAAPPPKKRQRKAKPPVRWGLPSQVVEELPEPPPITSDDASPALVCWLPVPPADVRIPDVHGSESCDPETWARCLDCLVSLPAWWGRADDWTAAHERMLVNQTLRGIPFAECDQKKVAAINQWRVRRSLGTIDSLVPLRDGWCEFEVTLESGEPVRCLFFGPASVSDANQITYEAPIPALIADGKTWCCWLVRERGPLEGETLFECSERVLRAEATRHQKGRAARTQKRATQEVTP